MCVRLRCTALGASLIRFGCWHEGEMVGGRNTVEPLAGGDRGSSPLRPVRDCKLPGEEGTGILLLCPRGRELYMCVTGAERHDHTRRGTIPRLILQQNVPPNPPHPTCTENMQPTSLWKRTARLRSRPCPRRAVRSFGRALTSSFSSNLSRPVCMPSRAWLPGSPSHPHADGVRPSRDLHTSGQQQQQ